MTQETITALPVEPTLVPLMTHFVLSNPGDPTDLSSLAPATIAERLSRIPLPPLLELAAAALSQMHRERGLPDPVYNRIVATAIQRALRLPAPLTVRCVNMASLAHQRTLTNEGRRKAGFSLLTVRLLRETQFNADQLSELTWATLLDPHTPQTESTSTLIEELAPKDLTQRLYPARPAAHRLHNPRTHPQHRPRNRLHQPKRPRRHTPRHGHRRRAPPPRLTPTHGARSPHLHQVPQAGPPDLTARQQRTSQ